jgi:starch phosphorylase
MVPLPVPSDFARLQDLAYNLWWSWNPAARALWSTIDAKQFSQSPNPITLLQTVERDTWEALAANHTFVERYHEVVRSFDEHLRGSRSWYATEHDGALDGPIAYLSAEYGIQEKLRLYSGGLGVLAGDHLKAASDLGLPLIGVGLLYRRGYFQQAVDPDGNQQHTYLPINPGRRPIREVHDPRTGRPLRIEIQFPERSVAVGAWRLDVGRVPLLLLDTELAENDAADRPITNVLYVRGREMRFCQELVLGVGGVRILEALGIEPAVWHVNEGHAAMSLLERLSRAGGTDAARQREIKSRTLFTLHTPVPAGNEVFAVDLAARYLKDALPALAPPEATALAQARDEPSGWFDLGAMAIRLSALTNGVSQRHATVVSRDWDHLLEGEALGITNGVHPQTWVGGGVAAIFRRLFGENWERAVTSPEAWEVVHELADEDLWSAHVNQKRLMLRVLRNRIRDQYARHGLGPDQLRAVDTLLPDNRLTMAFARRFATYKRANLLFSDPVRLHALLTDPARPVQIVFAGKAHPADREGQGLIRWVVEMSKSADLTGHIFFIENYDLGLAASLVQGADVWLNNPRPPKEASGTSGMKAAANGVLNLSVLDGWWIEGYNGANGWGFGEHSTSDFEDAGTLYQLLENEVVPTFYGRDDDGIPREWVRMMKAAIASVLPAFSAQRMVTEYAERAYLPLGRDG